MLIKLPDHAIIHQHRTPRPPNHHRSRRHVPIELKTPRTPKKQIDGNSIKLQIETKTHLPKPRIEEPGSQKEALKRFKIGFQNHKTYSHEQALRYFICGSDTMSIRI